VGYDMEKEIIQRILNFMDSVGSNKSGVLTKTFTVKEKEYIKKIFNVEIKPFIRSFKDGYCRICKICCKQIVGSGQQYCGQKCYHSDENSNKTRKTTTYKYNKNILCIKCGNEFLIEKINEDKIEYFKCERCSGLIKKCIICGNEFSIKENKDKKTCSIPCREELKKTIYLKKYGYISVLQNPEIKEKVKNTMLKKYGVDHNFKIEGTRPNNILYWTKKGYSIEDAKKKVSLNQSRSLEHYIKKYGKENGLKKYNLWITSTVYKSKNQFIDNIISKHKNLSNVLKYSLSFEYWISTFMLAQYLDVWFDNDIENFYKEIPDYIKDSFKNNQKIFKNYSNNHFNMYTDRGKLLRSSGEINFYYLLKNNNIEYELEKFYPNSKMKTDFYLPQYNLWIEIAGLMHVTRYKNKMELKHQKFNAIILKNINEQEIFIKDLLNKSKPKRKTLVDIFNK
jgi:predicted nucleic acid-binding Zn ribbon protein